MNTFFAKILISMIAINSLNGQVASTCTPQAWLTKYNFTAITPVKVSDGTCKGLYDVDTNLACVDAGVVKAYFVTRTNFFKTRAVDAYDANRLLTYADKYFSNINNNVSTGILNTSGQSWFTNLLNSIASFFTNLYASVSTWVKNVFDKTQANINPCFRAWNAISQGALCLFTSDKTAGAVAGSGNNFLYNVDIAKTGAALDVCRDLIDNYCTLTYGISISQTQKPYNQTFTWSDGGLSSATCTSFQTNYNLTTDADVLARRNLLVSLFNTANIPFVTSAANIVSLNNFLLADPIKQPATYVPVQNAVVSGIAFGLVNSAVDVNTFGANSGQAVADFSTTTSNLKGALRASFISVICLLFIWIH